MYLKLDYLENDFFIYFRIKFGNLETQLYYFVEGRNLWEKSTLTQLCAHVPTFIRFIFQNSIKSSRRYDEALVHQQRLCP